MHGLGLGDIVDFVAQSLTPHNRCVRFVAAVADGISRNTHYQAGATPYPGRTSTGWNPPASLAHASTTCFRATAQPPRPPGAGPGPLPPAHSSPAAAAARDAGVSISSGATGPSYVYPKNARRSGLVMFSQPGYGFIAFGSGLKRRM